MVESSAVLHRKFVGNVSLDRHLAKRQRAQPIFLRRNLTRALDQHAQRLQQQRSSGSSGGAETANLLQQLRLRAPPPDERVGRESRLSDFLNWGSQAGELPEWRFPSFEMLKSLTKGQKPGLRLDGLEIRPVGREVGVGRELRYVVLYFTLRSEISWLVRYG